MFGRRYFGARFFGPRYFGESQGIPVTTQADDVWPWWLHHEAPYGTRIGIALGRDVELLVEFQPGRASGVIVPRTEPQRIVEFTSEIRVFDPHVINENLLDWISWLDAMDAQPMRIHRKEAHANH